MFLIKQHTHASPLNFFFNQAQQVVHARLSGGGQCINVGAAQHGSVGTQRNHAHHVQAAADTGVRQNLDLAFDGIGNGGQGAGRGEHAVELAARVNLSASPCLARVRRLEAEGLIDRRVTLLNARKLGLKVNVFIQISLDKQRKAALDVFEREIAVLPEIMECYLMSGDADYLIRALVPDVDALERLIVEHITRIPGVASIRSSFALKQVLYTTAVPLS